MKHPPSVSIGLIGLSVVLLVCAGLWAFMHQWEYTSFHVGQFTVPVRTNRFTGVVQQYPPGGGGGWHEATH